MTNESFDDDLLAAVQKSRTDADMKIANAVNPVISNMLGDGRSVIDPTTAIWTRKAAEDLRARIEDNPIMGTDLTQWEKLDLQLQGASREVILLTAELVFLREHAVRSALPSTRAEHVQRVLAHLDSPLAIPEPMATWLTSPVETGGFRSGSNYNGSLWKHLIWAATFVRHWNELPETDREMARNDPWKLQEAMLSSGDDQPDIRHVLQFLARPTTFEAIAATTMKTNIRDGLVDRIGGSTGNTADAIDRDLFAIRAVLTEEVEGPFNFLTPGVVELWDPSKAEAASADLETVKLAEPRPRHYWLYAPGAQASMWDEFLSHGIMAIGWDELGDLARYQEREEIRQALDKDGTGQSMKNAVLAVWQFQNEIAVGDIIFAKRGRKEIIGRGEVTSEARFEPERTSYQSVRTVRWTHTGTWEHPGQAAIKTLTDITPYNDYVEQLEELVSDEIAADLSASPVPLPSYDKTDFLDEVYLSEERYIRVRSLLARKKNVILAGPPGVGKTFAAKRLAYSIMGEKDPSRVQMVQFHQSYSYEDFMMGYRPTEAGGFALEAGPFYRFCEEARDDDRNRPYFFIIDEINRGNISKIFGELLMLIEADKREHELRLLYKNEKFSVPANIHIIGMMNTADRSLAVLDYALRRRFGFFEMTPGFDTDGFRRWQQEIDSPRLNRLVGTVSNLNSDIAGDPALGRGFAVGHSFLSKPIGSIADDAWLHSVVEDEIIPLLEEYWFDEPAKAAEWETKLRAAVE